jgi:hypothetical protein
MRPSTTAQAVLADEPLMSVKKLPVPLTRGPHKMSITSDFENMPLDDLVRIAIMLGPPAFKHAPSLDLPRAVREDLQHEGS